MTGDAKNWPLNLDLHDPNVFRSFNIFTTLLGETFRPPRADYKTLSEILEIKQGNRKVHAYAQHVRYLARCIDVNPVSEFVKITLLNQAFADGPVWDHLFHGELKTFLEAIYAAQQEDFSLRQAHTTLTPYCPQRRPAARSPEPMDLCNVEGEKSRPVNDKRLLICRRSHKLKHYASEFSITRSEPRGTECSNRPPARRTELRGSDAVAKPQQRDGPLKMVKVSRGGAPY